LVGRRLMGGGWNLTVVRCLTWTETSDRPACAGMTAGREVVTGQRNRGMAKAPTVVPHYSI